MSTRANIGIYEAQKSKSNAFEALLYRHSDGYPSAVLPDIFPFLEYFKENRGMSDSEYLSARLLQYLCNEYDKMTIEFSKDSRFSSERSKKKAELTEKFTGTLGHGICKVFHVDIEYFYFIYPDGVKVYETTFHNWELPNQYPNSKNSVLLADIPVKGYAENPDYQRLIKE